MTEATFKPGDRVRHDSQTGTVLAAAGPNGWVPWTDDYEGCHQVSHSSRLTLIPDTVTVTVEMPRDELERVCETWPREVCERELSQAVEHAYAAAPFWRFRLACHDARDRESNR